MNTKASLIQVISQLKLETLTKQLSYLVPYCNVKAYANTETIIVANAFHFIQNNYKYYWYNASSAYIENSNHSYG